MLQNWNSWYRHWLVASLLAMSGALTSTSTNRTLAQSAITPDSTLGTESSRVEPNFRNSPIELLTGGSRRGSNLFHSFSDFNVAEGRAALFLSPDTNIQNILVRVTGSNHSEIQGRLGTGRFKGGNLAPDNANLFLINPNGIIFGPNAVLAVGGSFVASTAKGIKFADNTLFDATASQTPPVLTVNVPIGLQFGGTAGKILIQGSKLVVNPGKTSALVGGNITLDGGLVQARSGQISLGGILGSGTIGLNLDSTNLPLSFSNDALLGDISLINGAEVDASTDVKSGEGGGSIQLQGRSVTLSGRSRLIAQTLKNQNGREISILASQLIIQDSQVTTTTRGSGAGGKLTVTASDFIGLSGTVVEDGQYKPAGLFAQTLGSGDAGNLTIDTKQLIVKDGAQITAGANERSTGKGGHLIANASDSIELSGTAPDSSYSSGLIARTRGSGTAGNLTINTGKLIVRDKAQVTVESLGSGGAGNLTINADSIFLDRGELKASTSVGSGGNIKLQDLNLLLMRNNSRISAEAFNAANGGNIKIDSDLIVAVPSENSDILANASGGNGGSISIKTFGIFGLKYRDRPTDTTSDINASSQFGVDGAVEINTPVFDPRQGLVELQAAPVDISALIAQGCPASVGARASKFVTTGRGGLPDNPNDTLSSDAVWLDLVTLPTQENRSSPNVSNHPTNTTPTPLVEAQGWITGKNGEVILTATAPMTTPDIPWLNPANCHTNQNSSSKL